MHHISPMGSVARLTAPAFTARSPRRLAAGSDGHVAALKSAIEDAVSAAVEKHHASDVPVYVLDDEGDLCVQAESGTLRKLTPAEIDSALS